MAVIPPDFKSVQKRGKLCITPISNLNDPLFAGREISLLTFYSSSLIEAIASARASAERLTSSTASAVRLTLAQPWPG